MQVESGSWFVVCDLWCLRQSQAWSGGKNVSLGEHRRWWCGGVVGDGAGRGAGQGRDEDVEGWQRRERGGKRLNVGRGEV